MAGCPHVILVGLPGAGKTTVGRALAQALGWPFVDLDDAIAQQAGMSIAELFATHGERYFRELEYRATERLVQARQSTVVAPGGGWITQQPLVELVRPPSILIWLRLSPECALERMGAGRLARPLLAGADPLATLTDLSRAREAFYLQANHTVSVETMTPIEVVDAIVALARSGQRD